MGRINFKNSFTGQERVDGTTGNRVVESRDVVEVINAEGLIVEVSECTECERRESEYVSLASGSLKNATDVGDS
jgi:hypothetical protein